MVFLRASRLLRKRKNIDERITERSRNDHIIVEIFLGIQLLKKLFLRLDTIRQ